MWLLAQVSTLALAWALPLAAQAQAGDAALGRRIYAEGQLPSGAPLLGARGDGVSVSGAQAACSNCHRASGMGGAEGTVLIPPVAGPLLFAAARVDVSSKRQPRHAASMQRSEPASLQREAYTLPLLQRALVDGTGPGGAPLGYLMPRYGLSADDVRHLAAYLATLQVGQAPGLHNGHLQLATVVSDEVPPAERQAMVEILQRCVAERSPRAADGAALPWQLSVWALHGPEASWPQQLAEHAARQPVFALVSGLTGGAWAPVQRFCEASALPCVFPNTMAVDPDLPTHWTLHLSRGVVAEAAALVEHLAERGADPAAARPRVLQVVSDSEAARLGARALRQMLAQRGWTMAPDLSAGQAGSGAALAGAGADERLVLWLEPADLQRLLAGRSAPAAEVYLSGAVGGLEAAPLPTAWRERTQMLYPYEHADRRTGRIMLNAGAWMQRNGLALSPELSLLQGNTYSACEMTARALHIMRGRYSREYFMELIEGSADAALATGFPRFTLGANQRHGAKGAYLMRYDTENGAAGPAHLSRASDWLTER